MVEAVIEPKQDADLTIDELGAALEGKTIPDDAATDDDKGGADDKKTEEEGKIAAEAGDKKTDEDKDKDAAAAAELTKDDELAEMRQVIRSQKRDIAMLAAKTDRLGKRLSVPPKKEESDSPGDDDDIDLFGDEKDVKPAAKPEAEELSEIEQLSNSIKNVGQERGLMLETLLETMKLNPNFQDVEDVCSQRHFDDIFETIGKAVSDKDGTDATLAQMRAEAAVWGMPNPYKYMYNLIKEHHPVYIKVADDKKAATPDGDKKEVKKVDAPSSVANLPGSPKTGDGAWTAKRIDEMEESDLVSVPQEIYDKYLQGLLD